MIADRFFSDRSDRNDQMDTRLNFLKKYKLHDNLLCNCSVCVAIEGHYYATLTKINIHLIAHAFDGQIHMEIKLIAFTLMTSSKAHAPELKMIAMDFF